MVIVIELADDYFSEVLLFGHIFTSKRFIYWGVLVKAS